MNEIISYKDYVTYESSHTEDILSIRDSSHSRYYYSGQEISPLNYHRLKKAVTDSSTCIYCDEVLSIIDKKNSIRSLDTSSVSLEIRYCEKCNWWNAKYLKITHGSERLHNKELITTVREEYEGIIKSYAIDDYATPIELIRHYLNANHDKYNLIKPQQFEMLVASVFKDFFSCEVRHVGGPGDNGVDIYMVLNNMPILVQVKHRKDPKAVEAPSIVRELIGSCVMENSKHGIIVSSADRFSAQSRSNAVNENLVRNNIRIDLMNRQDFFSTMKLVTNNVVKPWEDIDWGIGL
ncbi:restriction endonuclease [Chryseolinea soli]|nr:restriction endonuclease [Chryseolinea soli]